jgi:undecaprenyl-diphosphatase
MIEAQGLIETDRLATLSVNGSGSLFWDSVASLYTSVYVWIPLALVAVFLIIRNVNPHRILLVLFLLAVTVLLCDQLSSSVCKPLFHRLRPTHDPNILNMVDTVNGYRGGLYGFFSGHAANSFGLAMFFVLLVKHRWFSLSVLIWAFLNSIIRTYLGVHFVGDIVVGAVTGMLIGSITYWIYSMFARKDKKSIDVRGSSLLYTRSGFMRSDVYLFISVLFGTYSVILILSCFN